MILRSGDSVPFSILRTAYQMAVDTVMANLTNGDDNHTLRDYWPACVALVVEDTAVVSEAP